MIEKIHYSSFDKVLKSDIPVMIKFYHEYNWYKSYGQLVGNYLGDGIDEKVIVEISEEFKNKVKIYKMDITENQKLYDKYKLKGSPCYVFFVKGKVVRKFSKMKPKNVYKDTLIKLL